MPVTEKIQVLLKVGFTPCRYGNEYDLYLDQGQDMFTIMIIYNYIRDEFYYIRYGVGSLAKISKEEIMANVNGLHTTSKNHFIKIEEVLAKEGIILP